jgi:hypothetical protein
MLTAREAMERAYVVTPPRIQLERLLRFRRSRFECDIATRVCGEHLTLVALAVQYRGAVSYSSEPQPNRGWGFFLVTAGAVTRERRR